MVLVVRGAIPPMHSGSVNVCRTVMVVIQVARPVPGFLVCRTDACRGLHMDPSKVMSIVRQFLETPVTRHRIGSDVFDSACVGAT